MKYDVSQKNMRKRIIASIMRNTITTNIIIRFLYAPWWWKEWEREGIQDAIGKEALRMFLLQWWGTTSGDATYQTTKRWKGEQRKKWRKKERKIIRKKKIRKYIWGEEKRMIGKKQERKQAWKGKKKEENEEGMDKGIRCIKCDEGKQQTVIVVWKKKRESGDGVIKIIMLIIWIEKYLVYEKYLRP